MHKPRSLHQQTIVITGASSGIGLATAKMAAKRGAKVAIASRNGEALREIAQDLQEKGGQVKAVEVDVTSEADMVRLRQETESAFGRIDTWVNNAGKSIYGSLLEVPFEDEKLLFETNFWGVRHGCHVAVDAMKDKGGVIINVGSEVSGRAVPVQGIYSATKHAVKAYTDALRMELEKIGLPIHVSLIRPTAINTPFAEHAASYLKEGEPSLPSPTYHPDVVAQAILNCAVSPQRDVYVGASSRVFDLLDTLLPRAVDKLMERLMFDQQTRGEKIPHTERQEALHHHPETEGRVLGASKGRMRNTSLYTSSAQHPWRTLAVVASLLAIGGLASQALDEGWRQEAG